MISSTLMDYALVSKSDLQQLANLQTEQRTLHLASIKLDDYKKGITVSNQEIADYYRKRWDIEVFFRFLKQELNLSHLVSMNKNGIEVMIYMTMIASMLLLIYKKVNDLGYKTAKRRIAMEIRDMITAILIIFAGGNPDKVFKT